MQDLIQKAVKGDIQAMTALYDSNKSMVQCICQTLLLDEVEAEKSTAYVFKNTMRDLTYGQIDSEEKYTRLVMRQAFMNCKAKTLGASSRAFRTPINTNFTAFPCSPEDMDLDGTSVQIVLNNLPPFHRFIYVMDAIGGYTQEEIARTFNTTAKVIDRALDAENANIQRILTAARKKKDTPLLDKAAFQEKLLEDTQSTHVSESADSAISQHIRKICAPIQKHEQKKKNWIKAGIVAVILLLSFAVLRMIPEEADPNVDLDNAKPTESIEATEAATEETGAAEDAVEEIAGTYADITIEDYGTITVLLDSAAAPETVENFITLAESGFYDGLTFHRIIEDFMMQGGDPNGDGTGGNTDANGNEINITGEFTDNGFENNLSHTRGTISMARSNDYNSASSQFFIVHEDSTHLDGQYAAFGYVTSGMDVVDAICESAEPTDSNGSIAAQEQPVIASIVIRTTPEIREETETTETTAE